MIEQDAIWLQYSPDLTTQGTGVNPDAEVLAYGPPRILHPVPGQLWMGELGQVKAIVRLPDPGLWNGKLLIGGSPAVRNEYALDWLLGDIALQRGYAFASCDKGTPGVVLRDPARSMAEWETAYIQLTDWSKTLIAQAYGTGPQQTYLAGPSNGGYIVRLMMERHPESYDGAVDWEGVFWHPQRRHLLTTVPVYVKDYPIYRNWRGDRTVHERDAALQRLLEAGLAKDSAPFWDTYFMAYWIVSLWLYGRSVDPAWEPFALPWSNEWLRDPWPIADYPWQERQEILAERIAPIANTGMLTKPLLSVAGNWDCLVTYQHNAAAYAELVQQQGSAAWHRMYEIQGGNHVDGMLRNGLQGQQPVQPYFEAALYGLEDWVERGKLPPASGLYERVEDFTDRAVELLSLRPENPSSER